MNYYEHHIRDYDADTAHLSWSEDMAYTRLLRLYYRKEAPIPADIAAACRLVRAHSKAERRAVEVVLHEFFELREDGWHHSRCDDEIARYRERQEKAARGADARWGASRQSGNRSAPAEQRPEDAVESAEHCSNDATASDKQCPEDATASAEQCSNDASAMPTRHQTPDTRHQIKPKVLLPHTLQDVSTPLPPTDGESACVSDPVAGQTPRPTDAALACLAMRQAGIADVNPTHPTLLALIQAGATTDEFAFAAREAKARGKGFAYAVGTVKRRREEAAAMRPLPRASPNRQQSVEERNRAVAAQWVPPELRQGAQA